MNEDAKECFDTASSLLQQATGCQPSVAAQIVEMIALGTIRWNAENDAPPTGKRWGQRPKGDGSWHYEDVIEANQSSTPP